MSCSARIQFRANKRVDQNLCRAPVKIDDNFSCFLKKTEQIYIFLIKRKKLSKTTLRFLALETALMR